MQEFSGDKLSSDATAAVDKALNAVAGRCVDRIRNSMPFAAGPSRPGSPPHSHLGDVRASVKRTALSNHSFAVYSDSPIAGFLEHGTRKMAARPFIGPELPRMTKDAAASVLEAL